MFSFIATIIIGGLAGYIAEKATGSNHGLIMNILIGIVGAVVGGWLVRFLGFSVEGGFIPSLIVATLGAILVLFVWRKIRS